MYTLKKVMFLLIKKLYAFSILNSKQKRLKLIKLRSFLYQRANIQNMIVYKSKQELM